MKVAPDTNVLIRFFIQDDRKQNEAARDALVNAELIFLSLTMLCEFCWVLAHSYRIGKAEIATTLRGLIDTGNIVADRPAVEAGLAVLDAGGDFADGVIAHEGARMGADAFVSFDKRAIRLVEAQGGSARLLA